MDGLSAAASIITVVQIAGAVITYLSDVKDAPKECKTCRIEASFSNALLLRLEDHLSGSNSTEPWFADVQALTRKDGPLDQYRLALEGLLAKIEPKSKLRKALNVLLWKSVKDDIARVLMRMERVKTLVTIALELDHLKLSQAIKEDTTYVRDALPVLQTTVVAVQDAIPPLRSDVTAIRDTQNLQLDAQKLQQHQAVMQWLSPIDFAAQQYDIISRKEEGTGQWFLDSAQFHAWQQGPDRTLFCPGIPGAGKTMVAAIAIDHLCKRARSEDLGVAYLFCNYKAQAEQTYAVLLATVLKQLMYGRPDIAGPVTRMHESHEKQNNRPSPDEIFRALQSACSAYSTVYLVVDALDECTDRDRARTKLIDRLRELQAKISVRVMFTSRFIPEIREKFQSDPMLEVRASEHDVRRYVAGQLPRLPKCIQRSSELIQSVQDKIAEAVDGMFLLARLHVDSLLDKKTTQKVKTTLQALKGGAESLEIAYNEAIERIEGQLNGDKLLAKQALSWITYAQRPLSTQELCHALAIEIGDSELDPDAVYDIDDILSVCAGLVIVDSESNAVRLVHYTTQEYFKRTRLEWLPNAQQDIALACVTYLSMDAFLNGSCNSDEAFEARLRDHMFLNYAARHWASHANTTQEAISGPALAFLRNERLVLATTQAALIGTYGPNGYSLSGYSQMFPRQTNGLHLAARQGCTYLAGMLLKELECSIDADSKDGNDQTPLLLAAQHGHEAVVRLLVERDDVEADAKDNENQTPLSWAARAGHKAVVRLLVERDDVEADAKDRFGRTPLSWAAEAGHEAVVRLLVERDDVEADAKDRFGQTPLSWAAGAGEEAVVRLLVERDDVEADAKDGFGQTPLSWAARAGHEAVVRLLVERDDVKADSKDNKNWTPLSRAARAGHEAVVRLLVERDDVEADAKDDENQTPLSWAARAGHEAVVRLLVERDDVEADAKDESGQTPLSWAAEAGHEAVVRLLVERDDVEADSKDNKNRTPLSWAARAGHEAVVRLLVERDDVEVDSKDIENWTPLPRVAKSRHEAVMRLLELATTTALVQV